jgi:hypothetical protein
MACFLENLKDRMGKEMSTLQNPNRPTLFINGRKGLFAVLDESKNVHLHYFLIRTILHWNFSFPFGCFDYMYM